MLWYTPRTEQKPPNLTDSLTLQEQEEYCIFPRLLLTENHPVKSFLS